MLLSCPSPSFLLFTCFRSAQRQLLTDQHHCAYLQVYFCLFLCQITDLCFVVLAYTKFTLPHLGSGAEKPSGSEGFNLSFVNLFDYLSWCEIMTREITLLIINAERLGSDTAAVVVYLGLLAPDTSTGARKPPLGRVSLPCQCRWSCLALTQSPRQGRCKYQYPPGLQLKWL